MRLLLAGMELPATPPVVVVGRLRVVVVWVVVVI
jgi:hypothetical protein